MNLNKRLRSALQTTAEEFDRALDSFEPTTGAKAYPERMVSYYYIRAIAKALSRANVLLELPVIGKYAHKQDNHIDALIFNDREMVLAEFKLGWAPKHWESLARDFDRLRGRNVANEIRRGFGKRPLPPAFIFLGADCWRQKHAEAWKSGEPSGKWNLPRSILEANVLRDYLRFNWGKEKGYDDYYFTWAVAPLDLKST